MPTEQFVADFIIWVIAFAFGSLVSWCVWLTIRHYRYAKPAYKALAGDEMADGHLEVTNDRFQDLETTQSSLCDRVAEVERKVDNVDQKTDRNYRLLTKLADKAGIDTIFFRGGSRSKPESIDADADRPPGGDD